MCVKVRTQGVAATAAAVVGGALLHDAERNLVGA